tara:strand:+ start:393 stop:527 length:135 start_codon:yes stop_codon:yes gene_type:complete
MFNDIVWNKIQLPSLVNWIIGATTQTGGTQATKLFNNLSSILYF